MRSLFLALLAAAPLLSCGWPATRMVPAADYGANEKPTISSAPAYTAGTNYVRTTSPDGATTFVCADGSSRPASEVAPGARPPC